MLDFLSRMVGTASQIALDARRGEWSSLPSANSQDLATAQQDPSALESAEGRWKGRARRSLAALHDHVVGASPGKKQRIADAMASVSPGPVYRALEPRMVFDGAAVATADAVTDAATDQTHVDAAQTADVESQQQSQELAEALPEPPTRNEIAFVDMSVADTDTLIASLDPAVEVVLIDPQSDGLEQIAAALEGRGDIDAIHIISHGEQGRLQLGNDHLDAASMQGEHLDELTAIGNALSADGDILIYGCDFTGGEAGLEAAILLGAITGADVAASTDLTGHTELGGDWDLETEVGSIGTEALEAAGWQGLLAPTTTTFTYDAAASAAAPQVNGQPVIILTDGTATITISNGNGAQINGSIVTTDASSNGPESIRITATAPTGQVLISSIRFLDLDNFDPNQFVDTLALDQAGTWSNLDNASDGSVLVAFTNDAAGEAAATLATGETTTFDDLRAAGAISDVILNPISPTENNYRATFTFDTAVSSFRLFGSDAVKPHDQVTSFTFNALTVTYDRTLEAKDDSFNIISSETASGNLTANDSDPDGDAFAVTEINGVAVTAGAPIALANGTLTVTNLSTGAFTFTPNAQFGGTQTFTYTIRDTTGQTDTATVTINVELDSDGDGVGNSTDIDDDNDGILDTVEGTIDTTFSTMSPLVQINATGGTSTDTIDLSSFSIAIGDTVTISDIIADGDLDFGSETFTLNFNSGEFTTPNLQTGVQNAGSLIPVTTPVTQTVTVIDIGGGVPGLRVTGTAALAVNNLGPPALEYRFTISGGITSSVDTDGDGLIDSLDIDSDNDGITDNVEAQSTANYIAPSGTGAGIIDANNDGLDDRYDSNQVAVGSNAAGTYTHTGTGLTPVDTDSTLGTADSIADFRDTDSDNDGVSDAEEAGHGFTLAQIAAAGDSDNDGLKNNVDSVSGFDVNDDDRTQTTINLSAVPGLNATGSNAVPLTTDLSFRDVNDVPTDGDETNSVTEDVTLTVANGAPGDLLNNASDLDGDALTITAFAVAGEAGPFVVGTPYAISGVGTITINADGSYSFAPAPNYTGAIPAITYTVSDGNATDTSTLQLSIVPQNDAPTDGDETNNVTEDVTLTVANGAPGDLLNNASDLDGDALTITAFAVAGEAGPFVVGTPYAISGVGSVTINADGSYSFAPEPNYTGAIPAITYTVSDGNATDTSTLQLSIVPQNDAPTDGDETNSVTEDVTLTVANGAPGDLLNNASDLDGDALTITGFTVAGEAGPFTVGTPYAISSVGTITINADGSYSFAPAPNYTGAIPAITYTVSDGNATDTSTLQLSIVPQNDAPTDGDETNNVTEDVTLTVANGAPGDLLNNASDLDGDALTITGFSVAGEAGPFVVGTPYAISGVGTITINVDGSYGFAPAANYTGAIPAITYTVSDGNATDTSTLQLSMVPQNDAPTNTVPGGQVVAEDSALPIGGVSVGDIDGDTLTTTLSVTNGTLAVTTGGGATVLGQGTGLVTITGSAAQINAALAGLTYTNTPDSHGTDTLTIATTDGNLSDTDTIAINVSPVADIANDTVSTLEDTAVTFNVVTGTNGATADSFEGTPLVTGHTNPANGSVNVAADGTVTYTPNPNFNGTDTFTYTVTSGGVTETATVTVNVGAVNDTPVAADDSFTVPEDGSTIIPVLANDSDIDGDTLTVSHINGQPATVGQPITLSDGSGTATLNANGTITFTAAPNYNGAATFTYAVTDGALTATATVSGTVTPVNDPPAAADDIATAEAGRSTVISVLTNDTDSDGDTLFVTAATASNGSVTINADGTISYLPAPGFAGVDAITYTISDGKGGTATATVFVTVPDQVHPLHDLETDPPPAGNVPFDTITADGAVLDALAAINGQSGIASDGIIVATANGIASLNGIEGRSEALSENRLWQLGSSVVSTHGGVLEPFEVQGLTGFSLRIGLLDNFAGSADKAQVIIETLVRDKVLYLQLSNSSLDGERKVSEYRVTLANGQPLPGWLAKAGSSLYLGERPADVDTLKLRIVVIYDDGTSDSRSVELQAQSGEIQPLPETRASLTPKMFDQQFDPTGMPGEDSIEGLAELLKRKA